jgi:hypothetical protein
MSGLELAIPREVIRWSMPKYLVQIDARNFLVDLDGSVAKRGFVTLRYVEASDARSAEFVAVQTLRDDQEFRAMVKNDPADPPTMEVLDIVELESFDVIEDLSPGRIWYDMNPKRWWQFWRR